LTHRPVNGIVRGAMNVLTTPRLHLRQWRPDDWLLLRPIVTDARMLRFIGRGEPWSDERIQTFVNGGIDAAKTRGWILWPVIHSIDEELIGFCGFNSGFAPDVEIGWWIAPHLWGCGLATEVGSAVLEYGFRTFKFPRVISVAQPGNVASIRVMQKLGMTFDRSFTRDGIDLVSYAKVNPFLDAADAPGRVP